LTFAPEGPTRYPVVHALAGRFSPARRGHQTRPKAPTPRGRAKFEEARKAEKAGGDFDTPGKAALAAYDEAVKADPGSAEARAGRGDVRASLAAWRFPGGDFTTRAEFEAAIADFDEAIKLDPKRPESYAGRGFARFKLSVAVIFARGDIDDLFKAGFEFQPGDRAGTQERGLLS
jgi:tetratricopeptide (TPR) repeat protein